MSHLQHTLLRCAERRGWNQSDLARQSGISRSYISRLCSGEAHELSDANFVAILNAFAPDSAAQADLIAARCQDVRIGPGAELVDVLVRRKPGSGQNDGPDGARLTPETERAFAWLRSQCPLNPALEQHILGYAKLMGMR
jgi:transcriptional regulator with XRE-family HTH domain